MNNIKRNDLMEAAKISEDPMVEQALNKLLFVVSLTHDPKFIEDARVNALQKLYLSHQANFGALAANVMQQQLHQRQQASQNAFMGMAGSSIFNIFK